MKNEFRPRKINWDRDTLIYLRFVRKLSFPALGRVYRCDHTTVMWAFRRLGISTQRELQEPTVTKELDPIIPPKIRVGKTQKPAPRELIVIRETPEQAQMWRDLLRADKQRRHVQA